MISEACGPCRRVSDISLVLRDPEIKGSFGCCLLKVEVEDKVTHRASFRSTSTQTPYAFVRFFPRMRYEDRNLIVLAIRGGGADGRMNEKMSGSSRGYLPVDERGRVREDGREAGARGGLGANAWAVNSLGTFRAIIVTTVGSPNPPDPAVVETSRSKYVHMSNNKWDEAPIQEPNVGLMGQLRKFEALEYSERM
ncbi:hypothetical protein E6O75_ATG05667 [Venturia nashicola]|uniref:Uncharacterized protein n=1 Tax=Venturia nashicola TaxID=86259 RepID=A0A4Z1PG18_9PEZI|nr:hypothetical protein E6O75_ATG05667 [Venturia nashicola]